MKRVLLLSTGGTIASRPGSDGLEPELSGEELIAALGDLRGRFDILDPALVAGQVALP